MFEFAETTKDMTAVEILNYYRNLYYAEPQVTERGIVANAINDVLQRAILPPCKSGQTVYVVDKGGMKETITNEITYRGDNDLYVMLSFDCDYDCENCPFNSWSQDYSGEYSCGGEYGCCEVKPEDFGKTVFLTREEAEAAFKERSANNG